jgi:ribonuclease HI
VNESKQDISRAMKIYTDGAIRPDRSASGLAAIVRDQDGQICHWWQRQAGALTCNEAEYAAVIFALEHMLQKYGNKNTPEVAIYSDSQVLVDQMTGRAAAHAPGLRKAGQQLRALVGRFRKVSFHHISREQNRLADALAFEAVEGLPKESQPKQAAPDLELWEQFASTWRTT